MDGYIIILLAVAVVVLTVLIAKLATFGKRFADSTRYICYEMDRAADYEEYRKWRGELRCHYLCLIPFVNRRNVMRLYNRIYHRADRVKKERKDSLVPLLLPSILGIFICTVCVCGMTWAWYSASVETPTQKLSAACYQVTVELITNADGNEVTPDENGIYALTAGTTYTVKLSANGSVKKCGGYCLIENTDDSIKLYTQSIDPDKYIMINFLITTGGNYTFTGVWGSHPTGTTEEDIIKAIDDSENNVSNTVPIIDTPTPDNTNDPAPTEPSDPPSEPVDSTYTVQSGDTLSGIAEKFNTTVDKLASYNGITDRGNIKAGQTLNIPPEDYVIPTPTVPKEPEVSEEPDPVPSDTEPSAPPATEPTTEPASDNTTTEKENNTPADSNDPVSAESP